MSLFRLIASSPQPLPILPKILIHRICFGNWYEGSTIAVHREFNTWLYAKSDHLIDALLLDEPKTWNFVKKLVLNGDVSSMMDVGACIGGYSVVLGEKIRVVAIEPMPDTYAILKLNIKLNKSNVKALKVAAYSRSGSLVKLIKPPSHSGASYVSSKGVFNAFTCTLDEIWERFGPFDIIKVDVEGSEIDCLKGLTKIPKYLVVEVRPNTLPYVKNVLSKTMKICFVERLSWAKDVYNIVLKRT